MQTVILPLRCSTSVSALPLPFLIVFDTAASHLWSSECATNYSVLHPTGVQTNKSPNRAAGKFATPTNRRLVDGRIESFYFIITTKCRSARVLRLPPTVQQLTCEVNWRLVCRCECECEQLFVAMWLSDVESFTLPSPSRRMENGWIHQRKRSYQLKRKDKIRNCGIYSLMGSSIFNQLFKRKFQSVSLYLH